jgi:hypothetical protein
MTGWALFPATGAAAGWMVCYSRYASNICSLQALLHQLDVYLPHLQHLADIQHLTINAYCFRYASPVPGTRWSRNTLSTLAALFGGQPAPLMKG